MSVESVARAYYEIMRAVAGRDLTAEDARPKLRALRESVSDDVWQRARMRAAVQIGRWS